MDEVSELRAEITRLSAELARLSDRLSALEPSPLAGEVAEPEGAMLGSEAPSAAPARGEGSFNWEALIGGQGALWIGSIAVFLALAFGLAYAWATIPPAVVPVAMILVSRTGSVVPAGTSAKVTLAPESISAAIEPPLPT